jgi:protein-disulfide isomerase
MDLVDSSQGNIAMVFKHVPVHGQASRTEALAAECAVEQEEIHLSSSYLKRYSATANLTGTVLAHR